MITSARSILFVSIFASALAACAASSRNDSSDSDPSNENDKDQPSDGDSGVLSSKDGGSAKPVDAGAISKKDGGVTLQSDSGAIVVATDAGSLGPIKPGFEFTAGTFHFYDPDAALRRNQSVGGGGSGKDGQSYNFPSKYQIDNSILLGLNIMTTPGAYPAVGDYKCAPYSSSGTIPFGQANFELYDSPNHQSFKSVGGDCVYHVLTSAAGTAGATWRITGTITGTTLNTFTQATTAIAANFDLNYSN